LNSSVQLQTDQNARDASRPRKRVILPALSTPRPPVASSESVRTQGAVRFGDDFEFDPLARTLRRAGSLLKLQRIPIEALAVLIEHHGELVTRDQLVEKIWGKDVFLDADNSLNIAIRKLRLALNDDPELPRFIQTVTGQGYRFIAPVDDSNVSEKSAAPRAES